MQPKYRYGLIALFFIAFAILTPIIILFVTGTEYDFKTQQFVKTGSILARSDPNGATIYINGKPVKKTNATLRFLLPGDYQITLRKPGYFDWQKRLTIRSQYVTYIASGIKNLVMFFNQPQSIDLAKDVQNIYSGTKRLLYLTDDSLYLADLDSPSATQKLTLPPAANAPTSSGKLQILPAADENAFLLYNDSFYGVFDATNNKITDISKILDGLNSSSSPTNAKNFAFSNTSDNLYFLAKSILYQINWQQAVPNSTAVAQNVLGFAVQNNYLYVINRNAQGQVQLQVKNKNVKGTQSITIMVGLPNFSQADIYITDNNQIFILGDGTLYAVQNNLTRIGQYVTYVKVYNQFGEILYATNNEIDVYDYLHNTRQFITRSSQPIKDPISFADLGWIFYLSNNNLQAIEIDNRDHQNNYIFASSLSDDAQFFMPPSGDTVFLLSQNALRELKIR